jgi:hypothetical protein
MEAIRYVQLNNGNHECFKEMNLNIYLILNISHLGALEKASVVSRILGNPFDNKRRNSMQKQKKLPKK